ncbi:phosphatase 2C-like domain-containing protein [Radiomyces spectabilis]|uniref:phosphatase 2C-like domain-containing protein n=1 Tax=Radiomyces spectabilis TaxID=64574 RepID=UPI002220580E|nr:phosphatase 2C-like domain-containing protein [Radiomyces spectabilis]KAI8393774.1 phosphatase 2C-like domain-containing protein [Radiomyces spectabilis]
MVRQYIQRMAAASQLFRLGSPVKPLLVPPLLTYFRPAVTQRLLHTHSVPSPDTTTTTTTTQGTSSPSFAKPIRLSQPSISRTDSDSDTEPSDKFHFVAHASWHPKTRRNTKRRSAATNIGNVDAGEDAFFHTMTPAGMALGVADGVGGWAEVGVDPALFSWTLMNNAAYVAEAQVMDAHHILDKAFNELQLSGKVAAGSSTACILNLCKATGKMTTCNLGDSAFLLIRDSKVVYESPSQQHYFNCPYQLTVVPETYPNRDLFVTDMPKDGDQKSFFLKENDIILLATDGYFDNVYAQETLAIVNAKMEYILDQDNQVSDEDVIATVSDLSQTLADTARQLSLDHKRLSPWARAAQAHGSKYRGGKVDDITCIVTLVRGQGSADNE